MVKIFPQTMNADSQINKPTIQEKETKIIPQSYKISYASPYW